VGQKVGTVMRRASLKLSCFQKSKAIPKRLDFQHIPSRFPGLPSIPANREDPASPYRVRAHRCHLFSNAPFVVVFLLRLPRGETQRLRKTSEKKRTPLLPRFERAPQSARWIERLRRSKGALTGETRNAGSTMPRCHWFAGATHCRNPTKFDAPMRLHQGMRFEAHDKIDRLVR
jgi:hypothetical protein